MPGRGVRGKWFRGTEERTRQRRQTEREIHARTHRERKEKDTHRHTSKDTMIQRETGRQGETAKQRGGEVERQRQTEKERMRTYRVESRSRLTAAALRNSPSGPVVTEEGGGIRRSGRMRGMGRCKTKKKKSSSRRRRRWGRKKRDRRSQDVYRRRTHGQSYMVPTTAADYPWAQYHPL